MRRSLVLIGLLAAALWSIAVAPSIAGAPKRMSEALAAPPSDAVILLAPPLAAPDQSFVGPDGADRRLADYAGKVVVLNFWATWCAPCVRELPSLDRLADRLPADRFAVLALSNDRGGMKKVKPFLEKLAIARLEANLDPKSRLSRALKLRGLPTTFILTPDGQVVAKLEGIAEWDSAEFVAWFEALAAPKP